MVEAEVSQSFGARFRLRTTAEFSSVFAARRSLRGPHLVLHYRPSLSGVPRLGVAIARKFARSAVLRNKVKRAAREGFRRARVSLPNVDLVLRLATPLEKGGVPALRAEIDALLAQLK